MINILIGTEACQWTAAEVLKHSLRRRTKEPLNLVCMENLDLGLTQKMYTGFSIYRFHVPALCGYKGRGIYMDADIVCLCDIAELHNLQMTSAAMARRRDSASFATSVMLMDCEKLTHWDVTKWAPELNSSKEKYASTMWGRKGGFTVADLSPLDANFNQLDVAPEGTKIIHYTSLPRQPWKMRGHACADIFLRELKDAVLNGVIQKDDVLREEGKGHVYAGLLEDALKTK